MGRGHILNHMIEVEKVSDQEGLLRAFRVRRQVFVEEQGCPSELEYENDDVSAHFLASYRGEAAGAARWRKTEKGYKLERFAVLPGYRGKGVGLALVNAVLADLPEEACYIYLHAQVQAAGMYERAGFKAEGPEFEEAGIRHLKMVYRSK